MPGIPGPLELLLMIIIGSIFIVPCWKICSKAGFSRGLSFMFSLLLLIPVANIIMIYYLAFAEWPALKNQPSNHYQ